MFMMHRSGFLFFFCAALEFVVAAVTTDLPGRGVAVQNCCVAKLQSKTCEYIKAGLSMEADVSVK